MYIVMLELITAMAYLGNTFMQYPVPAKFALEYKSRVIYSGMSLQQWKIGMTVAQELSCSSPGLGGRLDGETPGMGFSPLNYHRTER